MCFRRVSASLWPYQLFQTLKLETEQSVKWEAHVSILEFTLHRMWVSAQTFVETCSLFFIKSCPLLTFMTCFLTWTQKETVFHTGTSRGILSCNMKQNAHGICDWTTKAVISSWGIFWSNSQKYIVWLKIIHVSKIIRILSKDHVA